LDEAYAWMTSQRELWERKLDTVEAYLREQREGRQLLKTQEQEHKNRPA
jgi:hypothetical protein